MSTINGRSTNKKYVKKGGVVDGKPAKLLLNQEVPAGIKDDIVEPNVTSQLLDLNSVSMSILEQGTISALQADDNEQLICSVAGETLVHMVTGWQKYMVYAGQSFPSGD